MGRRIGCVLGLVAAPVLAAVVYWTLGVYLPGKETSVPRILWVILRAIDALPVGLQLPALALFSLAVGLGGGFVAFAGIARLSGRPL